MSSLPSIRGAAQSSPQQQQPQQQQYYTPSSAAAPRPPSQPSGNASARGRRTTPQQQQHQAQQYYASQGFDDEKDNGPAAADSNPARQSGGAGGGVAGSYQSSRFSLSYTPDPAIVAALRAYLPLLVYHAHPGSRDAALPDSGVLALFDAVAAHFAAQGRYVSPASSAASPNAAALPPPQHAWAAVGRATLAKVQELCMSGRSFRSLDALLLALRSYLDTQRSNSKQAGPGNEAVLGYSTPNAAGSDPSVHNRHNFLTLHSSAVSGAAAAGGAAGVHGQRMDEREYRRIKGSVQATIADRATTGGASAAVDNANPYLRTPKSEQNSEPSQALIPASAPATNAALSATPSALWSAAAQAHEDNVHELYDFLRGPACKLWCALPDAAAAADAAIAVHLAPTTASAAGVDISLHDVHKFVSVCGGLDGSRSLLCMVRELSNALGSSSGNGKGYSSMPDLTLHFSAHFFEHLAQSLLVFLTHSPAVSTELGATSPEWITALTIAEVHSLIVSGGAGVWTLVHLQSMLLRGKAALGGIHSLADLARAIRAQESERAQRADELWQFLSDPAVLRQLFVPARSTRALRPSQQVALGLTELPEPILPTIQLSQVAELMYQSGAGNAALNFVRVLGEQMYARALAAPQPSAQTEAGDLSSPSNAAAAAAAAAEAAGVSPFGSFADLTATVGGLVVKETLFHVLSRSGLVANAHAISMEEVNAFARAMLGANGSSSGSGSAAEQVRSMLRPGWALVDLLRGLDRIHWRGFSPRSSAATGAAPFDSLTELASELLGSDGSAQSNAAEAEQGGKDASGTALLVVRPSTASKLRSAASAHPASRLQSLLRQFSERKRTYLALLSPPLSLLYTGPRLTANQVDALYESCGVGIVHRSMLSESRSSSILLHLLYDLASWGHSYATLGLLVRALVLSLHAVAVRAFLRSPECRLIDVHNVAASMKDSSQQHQQHGLNLSAGHIDLLFAEMLDRDRDAHLLLPMLRELNAAKSNPAQQADPFKFFNLQQLLTAVRHRYHLITQERAAVFEYLTTDPYASTHLLRAPAHGEANAESFPIRVSIGQVIELIRASDASPHTLRLLKAVAATGECFPSVDALLEALSERVAHEAQEQWQVALWISNGVGVQGVSVQSPSASKPHGLFRRCIVRNALEGGDDADSAVDADAASDVPSFALTMSGVSALFSAARFHTLSFLRALDLAGTSVASLEELRSLLASMDAKRRLLKYLNSPCCGLFLRRKSTHAAGAAEISSIPERFGGREVDQLWNESQAGLATLSHLMLLESRIGERSTVRVASSAGTARQVRVTKGLYTSFAALVSDVTHLHSASLAHRKQVLAFLVQSSLADSASLSSSSAAGSSAGHGHHLFRDVDYPFEVDPAMVDELFEGRMDEVSEEAERGLEQKEAENGETAGAAVALPSSLPLVHSASILPLLVRFDRLSHFSFRCWSDLVDRLHKELAVLESRKFDTLVALNLQMSLVVECVRESEPSELDAHSHSGSVIRTRKMQWSLNDVDALFERCQVVERELPLMQLLQTLQKAQEDSMDEERDLAAAARAASGDAAAPAAAPVDLARHAFHSASELAQAISRQHESSLYWTQKTLLYLRFPRHGNLLCSGGIDADPADAAAQSNEDEPVKRGAVNLAGSLLAAVQPAGAPSPHSTPLSLSFGDVDALAAAASGSSLAPSSSGNVNASFQSSPGLLLPFLMALDANKYRFESLDSLAQALKQMWKQWIAAPSSVAMASNSSTAQSQQLQNRKYKRALLQFLIDFHSASAGLFELTAGSSAADSTPGSSDLSQILPYTTAPEPVVAIALESLDLLLSEVGSMLVAGVRGGTLYCAELLLLLQLRHLASCAPRFPSLAALLAAAKQQAKSWVKTLNTLHRFLNDSFQCGLLPVSGADGGAAAANGAEADQRATRAVSVDQVTQLMLETSAGQKDWSLVSALVDGSDENAAASSQFAAKYAHAPVLQEAEPAGVAATISPVSDLLERLLELDAAGRTFDLLPSLIRGLRAAQSSLAAHKRRVLAFLQRTDHALFDGSSNRVHAPRVTTAAVERLFNEGGAGFHTLALLRSLARQRVAVRTWSALLDALHVEHEVRLGGPIKLMRFLMHSSSGSGGGKLFQVPTISSGTVNSPSAAAASASAAASNGANFAPPVKLSLQLVSRMYHAVGAGPSTLNYVAALQAQAGSQGHASFSSLASLQCALSGLVNRDRVLVWLEAERESGALFARRNAAHKPTAPGTDRSAAALSFVLSPQSVDDFIEAAGTGASTLMYLQHLSRLALGASTAASPAASANSSSAQFGSLFDLVPTLHRMHAQSLEDRRRTFQFLNDFSVQSLLVAREGAAADGEAEEDDALMFDDEESQEGGAATSSLSDLSSSEARHRLSLQSTLRHLSVSSAQIDSLFESAGSHSFTLQHLQSLARQNRAFHSIRSLARAVAKEEAASRTMRDETLVFLSFLTPSLFSAAARTEEDGAAPAELLDAADTLEAPVLVSNAHTPLVTREEVDELFLASAAGAHTLAHVKLIASGYSFLTSLLCKGGSKAGAAAFDAPGVPPVYASMAQLIPDVSSLHAQSLEQRLRVLQFINNQERCTLLQPAPAASSNSSTGEHSLGAARPAQSYIPLAAVNALFTAGGAGALTFPFLLALQSASFRFHSLPELAWSVKQAHDSWEIEKRRVFCCVLQSGSSAFGSRMLLDFGGTALDGRTHRPVDVAIEELVSVAEIDRLFEVSQAGPYTLGHVQHLVRVAHETSSASSASASELRSTAASFHSWSALVQAVAASHEELLSRIHHTLLTAKSLLFTAAAGSATASIQFASSDIHSQLLMCPALSSGALGLGVLRVLRAFVAEQSAHASFPRVGSLQALGSAIAEFHAAETRDRYAVLEFLSRPSNYSSLIRVVPGADNAALRWDLNAVNRLFESVSIHNLDQSGSSDLREGTGVLANLVRLQSLGRRFSSFSELAQALQSESDRACAERRAVCAYLNDHASQSLFSNMVSVAPDGSRVMPLWSPSQVGQMCVAASTYPATLSLLQQFDAIEVKFNSLLEVAQALRRMAAKDQKEQAKVLAYLHEVGFRLLMPAADGAKAAASPAAKTADASSSGLVSTMQRLGVPHPLVSADANVPVLRQQRSSPQLSLRDVQELWAQCRLGPHLLWMLREIVEQQPNGESSSSADAPSFASISDLGAAVLARFESEVDRKRSVLQFLRRGSFRWGNEVVAIPSDVEVVVDLYTAPHTLRYLQRISARNRPPPSAAEIAAMSSAASQAAGGLYADASDALAASHSSTGRRYTSFNFHTAASLFEYVAACRAHDQRIVYDLMRFVRDPLRCAILPHDLALTLAEANLYALLDAFDVGSGSDDSASSAANCLCDSMMDLHAAFTRLEGAGVTVQSIEELQQALSGDLQNERTRRSTLHAFLHDPRRCGLFAPSGENDLAVPADLEDRLRSGECDAFQSQLLTYVQLLNFHVVSAHNTQQAAAGLHGSSLQRRVFRSSDEVIAELRSMHSTHTMARRSLFLWLNSPAHCSLIRPFAAVTPSQANALFDKHLMMQAAHAHKMESVAAAASSITGSGSGSAASIDLQSLLLNMQSSGASYPDFPALSATLSAPSTLDRFAVRRSEFLESLQAKEEAAKNAELDRQRRAEEERSRQQREEMAALRGMLEQVQQGRIADAKRESQAQSELQRQLAELTKQRDADRRAAEDLRARLAAAESRAGSSSQPASSSSAAAAPTTPKQNPRAVDLSVVVPAAAPAAASIPPLTEAQQSRIVQYLGDCSLFASTDPSIAPAELSIQPDSLDDLVRAGQGLDRTLATLKAMDAAGRRFTRFEDLIPAVAASAASAATSSSIPELSESDAERFVTYLSECLLFSEVASSGPGLSVDSTDMSRLVSIGGGLDNTITLLRGLDALQRKFTSFTQLEPEVASLVEQQRKSAEAQRQNAVTPAASPAMRPMPAHVGAPIITDLQLPVESPAATSQQGAAQLPQFPAV